MRRRIQHFDPRQEMQGQSFEVFHYREPKPAGVEVHHHDFYEVYFFLGGHVEYRVEGTIYHLEPGDLLLIHPMELHQPIFHEAGADYERFVLWISQEYIDQFIEEGTDLGRCFDKTQPGHTNLLRPPQAQRTDILMRLQAMVRESYSGNFGGTVYAEGLLLQFLVELNRIAMDTEARRQRHEESSPLVSDVLTYINEHYHEPLSLDSLAQRFFVSKYHLSHEFSRIVGTSVYRYITLKRLLIARQMLTEGIAPGTVYIHCGFGDYANFYRAFKAQYGISPSDCAPEK